MLVVGALDLLTGSHAVLLELLVVGPLIAATRCAVRETALVAVVALALALLVVGLLGDAFGDAEHVTGLVAVTVGGILTVIIARLRVGRERAGARLAGQYRVARVLSESRSMEEAGPKLLEAIGEPLGWDIGFLWAPDGDGRLRAVASWHAGDYESPGFERATQELVVEPGHGLPGRVWERGDTIFLEEAIATNRFLRADEADAAGLRGGIAFPVGGSESRVAVIELFSRQPRPPDPDLTALTETIGGQIREFIEKQQAAEAVLQSETLASEARDQLEAILRGVADAVTAQAPDGRLLFANEAAVKTLGFASRDELLNVPVTDILGAFDLVTEDGRPFALEELPGRRALAGEEAAETVVRFRVKDTGEERWSAVKATPIRDPGGRVVMAINVIEDITAHKRTERAQRFLADSSAMLGASLDPAEVLGQVATLAVPEMADWLFVDMIDNGEVERVAVAHHDPRLTEAAERLHRDAAVSLDAPRGVGRVLRTGRSELHPDLAGELPQAGNGEPAYFRLAREFGMRSATIVPMIARGRTLGALTLATDGSSRRFDELDLELAEELARRCATAIDNARLYSERSYIARTLQQSLLPVELPEIPGIEAAARFRAMGEGNDVGGDFYDMFETGGRGWTVVMGDVCGKGPDAAAVTALARYTLRAAAMRDRLPSRSLSVLNEALLRQRTDRRFCTVAYAYFEMVGEGARVGFASGGHPLPLLLHTDGTVEEVGRPGTLLGVMPDPSFDDQALTLSPGDALVFYTDGVIEARGSNSPLDERALAELVRGCAGLGADAIAAVVERAAIDSAGGDLRDDIAVLVLRVAS